jgi:hypothetical protein
MLAKFDGIKPRVVFDLADILIGFGDEVAEIYVGFFVGREEFLETLDGWGLLDDFEEIHCIETGGSPRESCVAGHVKCWISLAPASKVWGE